MQRAQPVESNQPLDRGREAGSTASRPTPLTLVSGAVAGDNLERVARLAADALSCPVAIALPAISPPALWPPDAIGRDELSRIVEHARALARGRMTELPGLVAVPVRIGRESVGIVAAVGSTAVGSDPDQRAWLEGAAAAAAVTALMREAPEADHEGTRRAFLGALYAGAPADVESFVFDARRLGVELGSGGVAIAGRATGATELPAQAPALLVELPEGRVLGLVGLAGPEDEAERVVAELRECGIEVALSAPRKDPAALHEALREAELLVELASVAEAALPGQEETYRLLIGVLMRDRGELELLHANTIAALATYDRQHDTELLATLQTFLAHHGSTTETAEAMKLHRHTVGYRLARVHEVSGLSPYESDGRERLGLGLKAHHILSADDRRNQHG
jgi:PucR C-terminal helix-turn-helix domain